VTARIAVIDDEAPSRFYLQTLLSTAGFEVQVAAGGNEGIALVEKERPDLVLLDLMMPEVDGFSVCERIRKGPAGAGTQIVVLSALDAVNGKIRALELGADDYLVKPVESRELVTRIKGMIDRADRLRQQGSQARGQPGVAVRAAAAARSRCDLHRGRTRDHLRRTDRVIPGPPARDGHSQPPHPARDLEPARQPAAEPTEVAAALKMETAAMILYQRDEFSAASKRRLPIVVQQPQGPAAAQFKELTQALAAV